MFDYPSYEKHYNAFDNYIKIFIVINKVISINAAIKSDEKLDWNTIHVLLIWISI